MITTNNLLTFVCHKFNLWSRNVSYLIHFFIIFYSFYYLTIGCLYSFPNPETLGLVAEGRVNGILFSVESLLINYDGRYTTNLLHVITPFAFGIVDSYKWCNFFSIFLFIFGFTLFFNQLIFTNLIKSIFFSALFTSIHFATSPKLSTELYLLNGSFVYMYGVVFWVLWVSLLKTYLLQGTSLTKNFFVLVFCILFLILSMGTSVQFILLNIITLIIIGVYLFKYKSEKIREFIPIILPGIFVVIFYIICPGWKERFESNRGNVEIDNIRAISVSIIYLTEKVNNMVTGNFFLNIIAVFLISLYSERKIKNIEYIYSPFVIFSLLIYLFFSTLVYTLGVDDYIPERIFNVNHSIIEVYLLLVFSMFTKNHLNFYQNKLLFSILLLLALTYSDNNMNRIKNEYYAGLYFNPKKHFDKISENIAHLKKKSDSWKSIEISHFPNTNTCIYYSTDLLPNRKKSYFNLGIERYFEINEVVLTGDTISKREFNLNDSK